MFRIFPIFVLSSLFLGLMNCFGGSLTLPHQVAITVIAVTFLGMPHGALDVLMLNHISNRLRLRNQIISERKLPSYVLCYGLYLITVIISFAFWLIVPPVALSLFLLIAIWHFRTDWNELGKAHLSLTLGSLSVVLPSVSYSAHLIVLFEKLNVTNDKAHYIVLTMQVLAYMNIVSLLAATLLRQFSLTSLVIIGCVLIAGLTLPPLVFFVAYFCGLHAILHTLHVKQSCDIQWGALLKAVSIPMAGTLVLMCIAHEFLAMGSHGLEKWLELIFISLFAVTVPHIILSWTHERYFIEATARWV